LVGREPTDTEVAHNGWPTSCPGGRPVERSVSIACCKMTTAAAWSITARLLWRCRPCSLKTLSAVTVVSRSSTRRTGNAWPRPTNMSRKDSAYAMALTAAGPRPPLNERGKPTTISTAASSAARSAILSRSALPRGTVSTGVATRQSASQRATPTRTSPTSTPRRTPRRNRCPLSDEGLTSLKRPRRCVRWRPPGRSAPPGMPKHRSRRPGRRRPCLRRRRPDGSLPPGPAVRH